MDKKNKKGYEKMLTQTITIRNAEGLHCRPASVFVEEMAKYNCDVTICFKGERINAKSILSIMTSCIVCGSEITIECDGEDEKQAMNAAVKLIQSEFKKY